MVNLQVRLFYVLIPALLATSLQASALGQLEQAAGASVYVPDVQGVPVDNIQDHTSSGSWTLEMDASNCPRGFYPEAHPTKGPYASEADCLADLNQYKYRTGAGACETGWRCTQSGGGASGAAGVSAIKSSVGSALTAAQAAVARNSTDRGGDLLAKGQDDGDEGARWGRGRLRLNPKDNGRLGDGPLQVLILKLQPWCGKKLGVAEGSAARAKAGRDLTALGGLLRDTRARLEEVEDTTLNQRQQAQLKIECGEETAARLRELAQEPLLASRSSGRAAPKENEGLGSTPSLLRTPEDNGGPIDQPYVDCATYKAQARQWRSGLGVQREAIAKTERLLGDAGQSAAEAGAKGRERAREALGDTLKSVADEAASKLHLAEKGLSLAMRKSGLSRQKRKLVVDLKEKLEAAQERAESMKGYAEKGAKFAEAGGAEAYMQGTLKGLQASWNGVMADPELREEFLNDAGEAISELGGPAMAIGYKVAKADLDLVALRVSQGMSEEEAAKHRESLGVMKGRLAYAEERIRFLEEEGSKQCEKKP